MESGAHSHFRIFVDHRRCLIHLLLQLKRLVQTKTMAEEEQVAPPEEPEAPPAPVCKSFIARK